MRPVIYSADDRRIRWDSEYDAANFQLGGRPDLLIYNKEGDDMPAAREGYATCGRIMKRVSWPRP